MIFVSFATQKLQHAIGYFDHLAVFFSSVKQIKYGLPIKNYFKRISLVAER
jgi:hypothetical protein